MPYKARKEKLTNIRIIKHHLSPEEQFIYIVPIADTHIGRGFNEQTFLGYRDWILSKSNAFTVLIGDILDCPSIHAKNSEMWEQTLTPKKARDKAEELFKPLAPRILGVVSGNHEERIRKETDIYVLQELLIKIGCSEYIFDPQMLVVGITLGRNSSSGGNTPYRFNILLQHGWGGARRTGGQVNKAEELSAVVRNADVYLIAHEHNLFMSRYDSAEINNSADFCTQFRQVFVGCGGFQDYSGFQKRIARRMPNIGAPRIRLEGKDGRKDIHVDI